MASKSPFFLTDDERERLNRELKSLEAAERNARKALRSSFANLETRGDGLEELVSALPPQFSTRFGEICWAQGGTGYGWWPSCIYDPRFTVGTTRSQARRQLGRKHLVYFFQCNETPFDLLTDCKIVEWTLGFAQGMHLGRTAKATGRHRFTRFREALQAAVIEEGKPQSQRLEWNHREGTHGMPNLLPSPIQLVASAKKKKVKEKKSRDEQTQSRASIPQERKRARRNIDFRDDSKTEEQNEAESNGSAQEATTPNRSNRERDTLGRRASRSSPSAVEQAIQNTSTSTEQHLISVPLADVFYCRIYLTDKASNVGTCVGYVELPRSDCTFTEAREVVAETLETGLPPDWRFVHPTLGPLSLRMEVTKGSMIPYLTRGATSEIGSGTISDPFKVTIMRDPLASVKK